MAVPVRPDESDYGGGLPGCSVTSRVSERAHGDQWPDAKNT